MACTIDFRRLDEGFGGKTAKRKRAEDEYAKLNPQQDDVDVDAASMEVDAPSHSSKRQAISSSEDPNKPVAAAAAILFGTPTYDGVIAGKVSGRKWKQARAHRTSALKVSHKGTTFEQRAKSKEIKKAYKERMTEMKEEIRQNKVEKRKKKEEREKKKQENILRTGSKLQIISNPKTLKKIAKSKQRKQLKVIPDQPKKK